jgi:hypothetical protein
MARIGSAEYQDVLADLRDYPDPQHYSPGCRCPRCSWVDAVTEFTKTFTGHASSEVAAYVLADAAIALAQAPPVNQERGEPR